MSFSLHIWLAVAVGGAIGAVLRFSVTQALLRLVGSGFPWGTLCVNVVGSFVMGVLMAWLALRSNGQSFWTHFFTVGVLGAFTTFSTFALDIVLLFERKAHAALGGYLLASVILSLGGIWLGFMIGKIFT